MKKWLPILLVCLACHGPNIIRGQTTRRGNADCQCHGQLKPVCASDDGVTYASECLAICQGVEAYTSGPCAGRGSPVTLEDTSKIFGLADIEKHKSEGFRLLGKGKVQAFDPSVQYARDPRQHGTGSKSANNDQRIKAVRFDYENELVYVASTDVAAAAKQVLERDPGATNPHGMPFQPLQPNMGKDAAPRRSLHVIEGTDNRMEINWNHTYPLWYRIGSLSTQTGRCTAALIGPSSVLTAAHCVFGINTQAMNWIGAFYPIHHTCSEGLIQNPYGSYNVSTVTYPPAYGTGNWASDTANDIAIVRLNTNLGDRLGWFGYKSEPFTSMWLSNGGYPCDKGNGDRYWWSTCIGTDTNANDGILTIPPDCDITPGHSGGPVFDGWGMIRGVVSSQNCTAFSGACKEVCADGGPGINTAAGLSPTTVNFITTFR